MGKTITYDYDDDNLEDDEDDDEDEDEDEDDKDDIPPNRYHNDAESDPSAELIVAMKRSRVIGIADCQVQFPQQPAKER